MTNLQDRSKIYAGIGSRRAPKSVLIEVETVSKYLYETGWTLRSGRAIGCDIAFENQARDNKEIYLSDSVCKTAYNIGKKYHPVWNKLTTDQKNLIARNSYQILGQDLITPCKFVVCWTPDGCEHDSERTINTGGTGQAISIASAHNIPVFNLARGLDRFWNYIEWLNWELDNENN